jgi:hypothetical protein
MSSRNASTLGQTRERIIILLVALSVPLIVQFFLYILASAAGATSLPVVGYGIGACSAAACTANGVSAIWLPGGPTLPTVLLTLLNTALLFIVAIVTVIEAIRLVGSLLVTRED